MTEPIDYRTMYECAAEFARSLILEANSKDEEIRRLEAEIRELQEQAKELRFNPNHDPKNGRFTSGNGVDISGGSGIIEPSPTGANELQVKGFKNKQKLYNHWKNGRTHRDEYLDDGITTAEQYEKRAVELLEMPVGGNILGHLDKDNQIVRYDKAKNDFVKGSTLKGVKTMFKPKEGYSYYENQRMEDIKHGGKA